MRTEQTDVCVVGSGAGGSVVAHHAAFMRRKTLLVEQGPYVRADEMSHSELEMIPRLYKDGGLQMNTSLDLFILQGSCVGGTTVVSNMVLLRADDDVFEAWRRVGADVSADSMDLAYETVERALGATVQSEENVSPSSSLFRRAAASLGHDSRWMLKALGDCRGCGGCNIGCVFDTKRSALTTYVAWAEKLGARVLAETTVERLVWRNGSVAWAEARTGRRREPVRIVANTFVVSAGAIGSSALLLRSGIRKNVGTRLSMNAGAMVTAEMGESVDGFDGDQMTVYMKGDGFLVEATHNPLMSAALTTPGDRSQHARMMRQQRKVAYAGALVGTEPVGRVVQSRLFGHEETQFQLPAGDLAALRRGVKTIAEVMFEMGATRVHLPSHVPSSISSPRELGTVDRHLESTKDFACGSSHPQGGNPMSDDPHVGAVDSRLAVHGFDNLFVCDASVFPTSIRVNPIDTIMAVAVLSAPGIVERS